MPQSQPCPRPGLYHFRIQLLKFQECCKLAHIDLVAWNWPWLEYLHPENHQMIKTRSFSHLESQLWNMHQWTIPRSWINKVLAVVGNLSSHSVITALNLQRGVSVMYTMATLSEQSVRTYTIWQGYGGKGKNMWNQTPSTHDYVALQFMGSQSQTHLNNWTTTAMTCHHRMLLIAEAERPLVRDGFPAWEEKWTIRTFQVLLTGSELCCHKGNLRKYLAMTIITFFNSSSQSRNVFLRMLGVGLEYWELLLWQKWGGWVYWELLMRLPWVVCYSKHPEEWAQRHVLTSAVQRVGLNS